MLLQFLCFLFLITVVDGLIGVEISGSGNNCTVTLRQSKKIINENGTATEWIKLDGSYSNLPCHETLQKPNSSRFSITTKSDGNVFLTFIVFAPDPPKKLQLSYLNPETKGFTSMKRVSDKSQCFTEDMNILPYLNFKDASGVGRIDYGSGDCSTKFNENLFFDNSVHELDIPEKTRRRKRFGFVIPEQLNPIEIPKMPTIPTVEAVNDITNKKSSCFIGKQIICGNYSIESPNNVTSPSMFASGNVTILKMSDRFNVTSPGDQLYIIFMDSEEPRTETWPNFVYIFDETAFEKSFFFSKKFDTFSSAPIMPFLHPLIVALIIQVLLI